jgi:hypothetical protein
MNADDMEDYTKPPTDPSLEKLRKQAGASAWVTRARRVMTERELIQARSLVRDTAESLDGQWHHMDRTLRGAVAEHLTRAGARGRDVAKAMGLSRARINMLLKESRQPRAVLALTTLTMTPHKVPIKGVYLALIDPDSAELNDDNIIPTNQ